MNSKIRMFWVAFLLVTLFSTSITPGLAQDDAEFTIISDIAYVPDGHERQVLDVYLPTEGEGPFPTMLIINDNNGPKDGVLGLTQLATHMAEQGFAAVAMEYRSRGDVTFPGNYADAFCALAWIHAHADEHGFDPERVVAFGYAYGAIMAATLGVIDEPTPFMDADCPNSLPESDWLHGVVGYQGSYATPATVHGLGTFYLNCVCSDFVLTRPEFDDVANEISAISWQEWRDNSDLSDLAQLFLQGEPLYWFGENVPPFLVLHGTKPPITINEAVAQEFAAALESEGVEATFVALPDSGMTPPNQEAIIEALDPWLATVFE